MSSDAKREANSRYLSKLDKILLRLPAGMKEEIKEAAAARGLSVNAYVLGLLNKDMKTRPE